MFWRVAGLATTSPVDLILDKDNYTLEELLDEDDLIQECKSLNHRLVRFLCGRQQVIQLVRYVTEEPSDDADDRRVYKYPFVSCEVFTCEIDSVFNTLLEDPEIMDLLFSFLEPEKPHKNLLAGYFSKVVMCLLIRRTQETISYLQAHEELLKKFVDLIGITSIMEVIMKFVGADDHMLMYHANILQWQTDTPLLDMLIDRLGPESSSDEQANAAEVLSAIARSRPSHLGSRLTLPEYTRPLFQHVLASSSSKSGVIHSLSVCISLLDFKRLHSNAAGGGMRGSPQGESPAYPEAAEDFMPRFGELLALLDLSNDDTSLPTTYGQLTPPLGTHRLKIIEFVAVLLQSGSDRVREELMKLGAIQTVLDLFFRFPFNNMLHHHVESIVYACLESGLTPLVDHLLKECNLVQRILDADNDPLAPDTRPEPRAETKRAPSRSGYMGHVTRMANKLIQAGGQSPQIDAHLQSNEKWAQWQSTNLAKRNQLENVFQWNCGRPAALDDRPGDSDEDDFNRDRDLDIATINLANNFSREYHRYGVFDSDDAEAEGLAHDDLNENYEGAERAVAGLHLTEAIDMDSDDEDEDGAGRSPSTSTPSKPTTPPKQADGSQGPGGELGLAAGSPGTGTGKGAPSQGAWFLFQTDETSSQTVTISRPISGASHNIVFDEDDDDDMDTSTSARPPPPAVPEGTAKSSRTERPTFSFNSLQRFVDPDEALAFAEAAGIKLNIGPSPTQNKAPINLFALGSGEGGSTEPTLAGEPVAKRLEVEDDDEFDVRGTSGQGPQVSVPKTDPQPPSEDDDSPVKFVQYTEDGTEGANIFNGSGSTPEHGSPPPGTVSAGPDLNAGRPPVDLFAVKSVEVPALDRTGKEMIWEVGNGPQQKGRAGTPRPEPMESSASGARGYKIPAGGEDSGEAVPEGGGQLDSLIADASAVQEECLPSSLEGKFAEKVGNANAGPENGAVENVIEGGNSKGVGGAGVEGPDGSSGNEGGSLEPEGTAMAMEKALREGIVDEAAPMKVLPHGEAEVKVVNLEEEGQNSSFNDVNFWKSSYEDSLAIAGQGEKGEDLAKNEEGVVDGSMAGTV